MKPPAPVFAILVMLLAAGPLALADPAPAGAEEVRTPGSTYTVYTPPATIDATGATDVSTVLSWWIGTHTAGGVPGTPNRIVLNGTYRVDYGLTIGNSGYNATHPGLFGYTRKHLVVDLTNARLIQTDSTPFSTESAGPVEPRKRWGTPLLSVYGGEDVTVLGGHLLGSNQFGRYSAQREAWHGIEIVGGSNHRFDGQRIEGVWGDFVYVNGQQKVPARDVVLANGSYDRNGRHGITVNAVDGLEVAGTGFSNVERILFDHEPGRQGVMANVDIHDNYGASGQMGFLNVQPTRASRLHDVTVRNHRLTQGHFRIWVRTAGTQRANFALLNNVSLAPGAYDRNAPMIQIGGAAAGFDGVTVQHNRDQGAGTSPALWISPNSSMVVHGPNDFRGFLS